MLQRIIFWLKSSFGFSKKESRGFLLVVPFLIFLYSVPRIVEHFERRSFQPISAEKLDSLLQAGWQPLQSELTFNPQDTATQKKAQPSGLQRIPLAEADSVVLQIVPGIGPALASRLIKYQVRLGGFHSPEQLGEVYGVSAELVDRIWEYFEFRPEITKKLPVNSSTVAELAEHPYISYGQAKVLVAYREQHGAFGTKDDLKQIKIFTEEWIDQINPYLDFAPQSK